MQITVSSTLPFFFFYAFQRSMLIHSPKGLLGTPVWYKLK